MSNRKSTYTTTILRISVISITHHKICKLVNSQPNFTIALRSCQNKHLSIALPKKLLRMKLHSTLIQRTEQSGEDKLIELLADCTLIILHPAIKYRAKDPKSFMIQHMNKPENLMLMEGLCTMKEMTENKWMIMLEGMVMAKNSKLQSSETTLLVGDKGLFS